MRRILLFFALMWVLSSSHFFAQSSYIVRGHLLSRADSSAVVGAIVRLQLGDKVVSSTLTGEKGYFESPYTSEIDALSISYLGGQYRVAIQVKNPLTDLGLVLIDVPSQKLSEVEIRAVRPIVRYEAGKVVYNLEAVPGLKGSDIFEALERIPSLRFEGDRGLLLNGFETMMVSVDKRPLRMNAGELEAYLRGLSISGVASVELIQNPSPEYGSKGLPVLNIVTRRHLEDGHNGYVSLRGAYQHYFREQVNARFNLNKGRSRSFVSYSFADVRSRETTEFVGLSTTHAEVRPRRTHQVGLGSNVRLGQNQSVDANIYGSWLHERYSFGLGGGTLRRPRLFGSLQHTLRGEKFEMRTALEGAWAESKQISSTHIPIDLRDRTSFVRFSPHLTYRIGEGTHLSGGVSLEKTNYHNDYRSAGSVFDFEEGQASTFVGMSLTKDRLRLQGSLEAAFYRSFGRSAGDDLKRRDFALLPQLNLGYQLAKDHLLSAEVKSTYIRPDFRDLTPITTQNTSAWIRGGNMDLLPSRAYNFSLKYTFMQVAFLELSYSDTQRPIVELPIELTSGEIELYKQNLDFSRYLRSLIVLPLPLSRSRSFSWIASTTGALQYQWGTGLVGGRDYRQSFTTYYVHHRHDLSLPSDWTVGLSATFYGSLYYGLYKMERTWWTEASLAKRIGAWRIVARVKDPWNSNKARGVYTDGQRGIAFVRDWHQPQISLTLSYSMGNRSLKRYQDRTRSDVTDRLRSESNDGAARGVGF